MVENEHRRGRPGGYRLRSGRPPLGVLFTPVLALFALATTTCRMPPFDEDLSLAVRTIRQLDLAYEIGPVEVCDLDEDSTFFFMPGKFPAGAGKRIDDGVFVETRFDTTVIGHVSPDPDGGDFFVVETNPNNPLSRFYPRLGEGAFDRYVESVVETSASGNLYILQAYPDIPAGNTSVYVDQYNTAARDFNTTAGFPVGYDAEEDLRVSIDPDLEWLGFAVYPEASNSQNRLAVLGFDRGAGTLVEAATSVNEGGPGVLGIVGNSVFSESLPETVSFHTDPTGSGRSYMSYPDGNGYANWIIDRPGGASAFTELNVAGRIERVLSTGELFIRRDKEASIYGPTGSRRTSFPMGDLNLAFEYYDGEDDRHEVVFTHLYFEPRETGDCDTTAWVRVYTLPTGKIDRLE